MWANRSKAEAGNVPAFIAQEVHVFALLPIVGGVLLGWLAPRGFAIVGQIAFFGVAITVLTISAPAHHAHYSDSLWLGPALAVVSAGTLLLGMWLARRTDGQRG